MSTWALGILFGLSFICFVVSLVFAFKIIIYKDNKKYSTILYFSFLVLSIFFLRYVVGCNINSIEDNAKDIIQLTKLEEIPNSIIHTLQSFSLDESYTEYFYAGKQLVKSTFQNSCLTVLYCIFASLLNICAPISGGAILLEILLSAFPIIKLSLNRILFWKTKYYFSELNEASLACAKSILKQEYKFLHKPVIIFTDAYTDGENEKSSELLKNAKAIGGICITDDITQLKHKRFFDRNKEYWLIDENEIDNIKALAELANDKYFDVIKKTVIRIFFQDNSYLYTVKFITDGIMDKNKAKAREKYNSIRQKKISSVFGNRYNLKAKKKHDAIIKQMPCVERIQSYQNLIYALLKDVPLYNPLLKTKGAKSLDVAILGNGNIGMEMFLSTYWCGQLSDIPLSINVVSEDDVDVACGKINKINPEILESTKKKSPLLKVYSNANIYNEPYFQFRYSMSNVDCVDISSIECNSPFNNSLHEKLRPVSFKLIDANYFLVALGDDDVNIRVAENLMRTIMMQQEETQNFRYVTITYVVYDSNLCKTLNSLYENFKCIQMKAVGSIDDTYVYENIIKKEYAFKDDSKIDILGLGLYKSMAMCARNIHYDYKLYSVFKDTDSDDTEWEKWKNDHKEYIFEHKNNSADKLAWLEHRRWNAYMRSIGFKYSKKKDVKILRTHDCLVEYHKYNMCPLAKKIYGEDLFEIVKKRDPNIIKYDYDGGIISKKCYDDLPEI